MVLGQGYRNPALTAKMASTIQYLTNGRMILGMGAGWKKDEYEAYGYPFPTPGQRITASITRSRAPSTNPKPPSRPC
jgi:alkanesulfonate monooxygenase SsuD/methylene tetrahydromethanopterin reductase-like flavin-dependent oxidoreductase (luciferase family)